MAKRKMFNEVRTDLFEREIIHYEAQRNCEAADVIRSFASKVGAPINEDLINERVAELQGYYRHIAHGGSMLGDIDKCLECN